MKIVQRKMLLKSNYSVLLVCVCEIINRLLCYLFFYLQNIAGNLYAALFHIIKFKVIVSISHINCPIKTSEAGSVLPDLQWRADYFILSSSLETPLEQLHGQGWLLCFWKERGLQSSQKYIIQFQAIFSAIYLSIYLSNIPTDNSFSPQWVRKHLTPNINSKLL